MNRMIFDLTDNDRLLLEAHRIRLGCRSHAEVLRALIRGDGHEYAVATPAPKPSFSPGRSKTVLVRSETKPGLQLQVGPTPPKPGDRMKLFGGKK